MQLLTSAATVIAMVLMSAGTFFTPSAALAQSVPAAVSSTIGILSAAACRDTMTVTVSGSSAYATNRVRVSLLVQNSDGDYILTRQVTSSNFGSGNFWLPIVVDYHTQPVDAGTSLEIIVQLQRQSGGGFVDLGEQVTTYLTAADRYCLNQCSVTVSTSDLAPTNGVITVRSHFGSWFRPEGWLHGVIPVYAGQAVQATVTDVACNFWVRVWFYPATGQDRTPRLLPSQYWPNE